MNILKKTIEYLIKIFKKINIETSMILIYIYIYLYIYIYMDNVKKK